MKDRIEQKTKNLRELFFGLYEAHDVPLTEEEEESLHPILNKLTGSDLRYGEPALLAEGGEKRIYQIYDRHLNRFVAMAKPPNAAAKIDQEQFLREGQLTANLIHPNIVPIYNVGVDSEGLPFFSMELVEGDSLKEILQKREESPDYKSRYSQETLLGIFNKVCDAVAYAHSRGVLHLDLKPDNIRVGLFGEVLVCDWGLARVEGHIEGGELDDGELDGDILNDITLSGIMKGTPGYMAPEQITGDEKTPQTDIYALGAILYMIMTHELPVEGENTNEVVRNTRKGNVLHPSRHRKNVPSGLAAVAMKAVASQPRNRYSSILDLQGDVNRFLTGYPTEAEHAGLLSRLALFSQRHRKISLWVIVFLALLTVVISVNLSIIHREKTTAEENLALYKEGQNEILRVNEKLTSLSVRAKNIPSYIYARHSISVLELLLEQKDLDSETRCWMLYHNARMQMVLQRFNGAVQDFERLNDFNNFYLTEKTPRSAVHWRELCRKYAELKPDDEDLLSDADLALLMSDMGDSGSSKTLSVFLYYHVAAMHNELLFDPDPEEYIKVVGVILDRLNDVDEQKIISSKLSQRSSGWHLDLSNTPYFTFMLVFPFANPQNVLTPLNLDSLDISHSLISLSRELRGLRFKELRMVGVSLSPKAGLAGFLLKNEELERVVVERGEYPKRVISELRKGGVEVIEEEMNEGE